MQTFEKTTCVCIFIFGIWLYYPALSLPPSLIDHFVLVNNLENWKVGYATGGLWEALESDWSFKQGIYNTGFWMFTAAELYLTGGKPFHWFKLLELLLVCYVGYIFVRRASPSRTGQVSGLLAIVLFLIGELPGVVSFQSLRANWYRLFTSDSDALVFFCFHALCILTALKHRLSWWKILFSLFLGALAAGLAVSIKLPIIVSIIVPLLTIAVAGLACGERKLAIGYMVGIFAISCLSIAYIVFFRRFSSGSDSSAYSSNYSFSPGHVASGVKLYISYYWAILGPILPAAVAALLILIPRLWNQRTAKRSSFMVFAYVLAFTACAIVVYTPWNARLPRYMLHGYFGLVVVIGILVSHELRAIEIGWRRNRMMLLILPIGCAMSLAPPAVLIVVLAALCAYGWFGHRNPALLFAAGVKLTGFIFLLSSAPIMRNAFNNYYIGRENANWETTQYVLKLSAEKQSICVFDRNDEHIGSMAGYISRFGIEPLIFSVSDEDNCSSTSLVLINSMLSPPSEALVQLNQYPVVYQANLPAPEIKTAITFWEFRNRLFRPGKADLLFDIQRPEYVWKLFDPGQ